MSQSGFLGAVVALALLSVGCSEGDGGSGGSAGTATTSSSGSGGSGTGGAAGTGGHGGGTGGLGGAGGDGGAGGGSPVYGHCRQACATPADCCPPDEVNCPSDQYPTNYTCNNGVCGRPECQSADDCVAAGFADTSACVPAGGLQQCVQPCAMDTDCPGTSRCIGLDDDMGRYCSVELPTFVCMEDAECDGFGRCVEGDCACRMDGDECPSGYACAN